MSFHNFFSPSILVSRWKEQLLGKLPDGLSKTILFSRQPLMRILRGCLFTLCLVVPVLSFRRISASLMPANFYQRDFIQEYLLAKALLKGENLYLPLVDLAKRLVPDLPVLLFSHPTPHPPPAALFFLPLAFLTYEQAVVVWFGIEIVCIFSIVAMLLKWLGVAKNWKMVALFSVILMAWEPFVIDIALGQISVFLLLFLLGSWLCLRQDHDVVGGILLGVVLALKLMAWPIVIYLVLRKRWRAVISSGLVVGISNLIMGKLIGFDTLLFYYFSVGPTVSAIYRGDVWNLSAWSMGWTLWDSFYSSISPLLQLSSLVDLISRFAPYSAVLSSLLLTALSLYFSLQCKVFDLAFGILTCASILVNPVTWAHYFTWLVIPLAVLGRYLYLLKFPRPELRLTVLCVLIMLYSWGLVSGLAYCLVRFPTYGASLNFLEVFLYLPAFGVLFLMGLLFRINRECVQC